LFAGFLQRTAFIRRSSNKLYGTGKTAEHRRSPFVVGRAVQTREEKFSMMNRLMITAATAALIAGTGLANAQGVGGREGGAAGGAGMQQSAPSAPAASPSAGAPSREGSSEGMKATQSEEKGGMKNQRAQQDMKSGPAGEKSMGEKSAQDTKQDTKADHSKGMTQNEKGAAGKDMKAEDERKGNMKAEGRDNNNTAGAKQEERSQTVGQAGAGAKLSTEQRTKITTVIRDQHIAPATNINFSISVGTRVPREVGFHPLPAEIVTYYPDWRGYEFFLVRDQIVVVDPRTLEIVAVLDA
jgi:hypothetical protein